MPARDPDIAVIGSGPNGLVAACMLAKRGFSVLVLEAHPLHPGGAVATEQTTLPGFLHDVGAGFFPLCLVSPAFAELDVVSEGVRFAWAEFESCHPAQDGSYACVARDPDLSARHFGSERDGDAWRRLAEWHAEVEPATLRTVFSPFPPVRPLFDLGLLNTLRLIRLVARSTRSLSRSLFETEAARRVLPALALHVDVAPKDAFGAAVSYLLGLTASTGGYAVPIGGAVTITNALVGILERYGGRVRLGSRVSKILVRGHRAKALVLETGEEIPVRSAVLADTAAPALLLELLDREHVPSRLVRRMQRYPFGWGTLRVDYALAGPVPWTCEAARSSAVVHLGESVESLDAYAREVRDGRLPDHAYLVVGQQSLIDHTRAPRNQHTLYCYTHVPREVSEPWTSARETMADRIEGWIEDRAPGFRQKILARHIEGPRELEAKNENIVGGDLGGGTNRWTNQLFLRPAFPYFRYRMPVGGVYLCSAATHPGGGVHGMCGYNAALAAARDLGAL